MTPTHPGLLRYALVHLAGLLLTIAAAAVLLWLALGGTEPFRALAAALGGELGLSASLGEPVAALIAPRLAVTLPLAAMAIGLAALCGALAGYAAARHPGSILDMTLMGLARIGLAAPALWLGMVLVLVVAGGLKLLPPGGFVPWEQSAPGALVSLLLPAMALALPSTALIARAARRRFAGIDAAPAVLAGRTRGLAMGIAILRHGFLAAAVPLIPLAFAQFGLVLAGSLIIEPVFYLPGLGRLLFDAVAGGDMPVVRAVLLLLIAATALLRFAGAVIAAALDPRIPAEEAV